MIMVKIVLDYLRVVTDDITLCLEVDLFAVPSTGAQWHDTESPGGGVCQHDPPQPPPSSPSPPPSPPSCRAPRRVWGLRLLESTIVSSPGDIKRYELSVLRSVTDPWRVPWSFVVTSEKLQPKSNTKLVLLTKHLYVQYVGTNWTQLLRLFVSLSLSGWDPSQLCPASRKKSGTLWFRDHNHYKGTRGGLHVTMIQFIKEIHNLFIQLAFLISSSVCIPPFTCPPSSWKTHCIISSHYKLCNYLRRYYYLYVLYTRWEYLHPSKIWGELFRLNCMTLA